MGTKKPYRKVATQERSEDTRWRVCSTMRDFLRSGRNAESISVADLIKASFISKGGFYYHFKSRDAVLSALYETAAWQYFTIDGKPIDYTATNYDNKSLREIVTIHVRTLSNLYRRELPLMRSVQRERVSGGRKSWISSKCDEIEKAYYESLQQRLKTFSFEGQSAHWERLLWMQVNSLPTLLLERFGGDTGSFASRQLAFGDDNAFLDDVVNMFVHELADPSEATDTVPVRAVSRA